MKWHQMTGEDTLRQLESRETGLTAKEASGRLRKYGKNTLYVLPKESSDTVRKLLTDPSVLLFAFVALLTACFSELFSAISAVMVCGAWCGFVFRQLYVIRQERARIRLCSVPTVTVLRNGKRLRVSAIKVTVGDVILLLRGDIVPADCRLLSSAELRVRFTYDSGIGAEKKTVFQQKNANTVYSYQSESNAPDYENMLYGGAEIIGGHAKAVVCAVGQATFCGASQKTLVKDALSKPASVLTEPIRVFGLFGMIALLLLIPLSLVGMLISPTYQSGLRIFFPLCAWAFSASAVLPYCYVHVLAHHGLRQLFARKRKQNGGLVKSSASMDRLPSLNDLVVIGDAAFSDGKLHFDSAFVGGKHLDDIQSNEAGLQALCEAFCLLERARSQLPATLSYLPVQTEPYLEELISVSGFDRDALELRTKKTELFRGKREQILDVEVTDGQFRLRFYHISASLFGCGEIYDINGKRILLSREIRDAYASYFQQETERGASVVTVIKEQGGHTSLLGCISKREAYLENASQIIESFSQMHVSTRLFLSGDKKGSVALAKSCFPEQEPIDSSSAPILSSVFESHRVFIGYSENEISKVVQAQRQKGRVVGVVCHDIASRSAMSASSVSFVCESDRDCIPILRRDADVLIARASTDSGGLVAVRQTILDSRQTLSRIRRFFKTLLTVRIMQATALIASVVSGIGAPPSFVVLYGTLLTDLCLLTRYENMKLDSDDLKAPLRKRSENLLSGVILKQFAKTAVLPLSCMMILIAISYHLSLLSSVCCYTLMLISVSAFPSLLLFKEQCDTKKHIWISLLLLWLPILEIVLLSSFLPSISARTELGGWSVAGGIALILCLLIEVFCLLILPKRSYR